MGGQAHQINWQGGHVDVDLASSLSGINMENDTFLAAQSANGRDILNHANFIVHEHHADQDGVWTDRLFEYVHIQQTVFLHVQVSDLKALALQLSHGV